jgi:hypothetical protein
VAGLIGEDREWAALVLYPGGLEMLDEVEEIFAWHCAPSATGQAPRSCNGQGWRRQDMVLWKQRERGCV